MTPSYSRFAPNRSASNSDSYRVRYNSPNPREIKPKAPRKLRALPRERVTCGSCPEREVVVKETMDNRGTLERCGWYAESIPAYGGGRKRCPGCLAEGRPDHAK